ncbi:hypothetical protein N7G274_002291 [Stereocaulon virgatum]|uniref:Uncharacterized protein n=1 Tax=Stereocaulon virgatum TaxID=373712 RepID=A0ABR4AHG9_9LECA
MGFAECYYANAVSGYSPWACDKINANAECKQPVWADFKNMWNGQGHFYVAWTIWNLNSLFSNYYQAIFNAQGTVATQISSIINIINPVKPADTTIEDILTALSVGLAFIPDVASAFEEGEALVKGLITAAQQAPGVGKYVFATGTSDSQQFDYTKVSESLGHVVTAFKDNYVSALQTAADDVASFTAFASNFPISGQIPDLNTVVDKCLTSLYTLVISRAYQADNVILTRQVTTDVNALCSNGTHLNWNLGCGNGYGKYGECATFWYDSKADISYALTDTQDQMRDFNSHMQTFFNGMTTGALLLGGADACAQASKSNQGSLPIVDTSPNGATTPCLSNLQACTGDLTAKPKTQPNPFTDCPPKVAPKFYYQACADLYGTISGAAAPIQYLGWGLLANKNYQNAEEPFCVAYN